MEPASGAPADRHARLLDEISAARSRASADAVAALGGALDAAGLERDPERREAIDRAVLHALRHAGHRDRILERVDLESLAGLADRVAGRLPAEGAPPGIDARTPAWDLLDLLRRPVVLRRIDAAGTVPAWTERIVALVDRSHLTMGQLFRRRAEEYGGKTLFEIPGPGPARSVSWRQASARVDALARGLLRIAGESGSRVAILSDNRLEMALVDLACHAAGLVSILIPPSSTESDVAFMLRHAGAAIVLAGSRELLATVQRVRDRVPSLATVLAADAALGGGGVLTLDDVAASAGGVAASELERRRDATDIRALATVMYTSGTTGTPKGVQFSNRNIVVKRFCRALALPEIGEDDVLLCYLPLYHTFGRYLEMYGCVFWGATYVFLESPSVEALLSGLRRWRPTTFISVPKKWIQLHESIVRAADPDRASAAQMRSAVEQATGGRLRWGLSAAGHLDAEIFRFFQANGVELMSGFGMTEATGGITMTKPGRYRDDTLGEALPGIALRVDAEGELSVRGPYVTIGHLDPGPAGSGLDPDGWFRTGDLMEIDEAGHLRLVDRKKEIYKNVKGETIAPARIEGLFRDFASVGRVFLVGDHREYNTALIWPNPETKEVDFASMSDDERKSHFRSIVASVNAFLAPYERIVDFGLIDRDLSLEKGELTPKGTPRRKVVEAQFAEAIRLLYRRAQLPVGRLEIIFPNWLFQALGSTAQDLRIDADRLVLPTHGTSLAVRRLQSGVALIGSCVYRHPPKEAVPLGVLLTTPRLWLGNEDLVNFAPLDVRMRERPGRAGDAIERKGRVAPGAGGEALRDAVRGAASRAALDLMDLHHAALLLESSDESGALEAVALLGRIVQDEEGLLSEPAREVLRRGPGTPFLAVRRRAFVALAPLERETRVRPTLQKFLSASGVLLDPDTRAALCERTLSDVRLLAFIDETREVCRAGDAGLERRAASLLKFLAEYGASHPARYRHIRAFLVRMMLFGARDDVRQEAWRALDDLVSGFRQWLGPAIRVAVDPETGQEYGWESVIVFDDAIPPRDRDRLREAIRDTAFLREAIFLFSGGATPRLGDIPPGGVWIRPLGDRHGKTVYRITVQTRFQGAYDVAANLDQGRAKNDVRTELHWLVLSAEPGEREPLVGDFGGYWPGSDLWSEEFIPGDPLDKSLKRQARLGDDERLRQLWPFFAWSALAAHYDFWNRTGRTQEIADPGMENVIVPAHDYQTGARIVSVAAVRPHAGLVPMLRFLREAFVAPVEAAYPALAGMVGWGQLVAPLLEIAGEREGLHMLREILHREDEALPADLRESLRRFIDGVESRGFMPMRLYFAVRRYRRWAALSGDATPQARARTLLEFWETYGLARLAASYPETRTRFFLETVLAGAPAPVVAGLQQIVLRLRRGELVGDAVIDAIAEMRAGVVVGPDDDYFVARLSYPHLRPEDAAGFVRAAGAGRPQSEMVVTLEDHDGDLFQVRHALTPKEVGRLHRLFLAAKLDVQFRPEHQYLVAINERGALIGGIYYEFEDDGRSAHLEKIVVAEAYRKKGVADGLIKEFFSRMRAAGAAAVTTGFFRPEYFYAYGFKIEKRYAGLVKEF